jgi:heptosyltransferase-2
LGLRPKTILVRAPNWIGDQVLAYPFFVALRAAYPQARITSVCVPWVKDLQFKNCVDEVRVLEVDRGTSVWERFVGLDRQARALARESHWDLGISLPNSFSAAWLMWRAGVQLRRGYATEGRGLILNSRIPWPHQRVEHRAEAYARLLPESVRRTWDAREFWGEPPKDDLDPGSGGVLPRFEYEKEWSGFEMLEPPSSPYWVLAPGATADARRWPEDAVFRLAEKIAQSTDLIGVVVGGPSEVALATRLCAHAELRLYDRVAQGGVPGLARLFAGARFTVSNESGLAHVAALCGSPVQIVCGAADPRRTTPIGPGVVQVRFNPVECWPCEKNTCFQPPEKQIQCLRGITPEQIWKEIEHGILKRRTFET